MNEKFETDRYVQMTSNTVIFALRLFSQKRTQEVITELITLIETQQYRRVHDAYLHLTAIPMDVKTVATIYMTPEHFRDENSPYNISGESNSLSYPCKNVILYFGLAHSRNIEHMLYIIGCSYHEFSSVSRTSIDIYMDRINDNLFDRRAISNDEFKISEEDKYWE
jgi:hypothetical protein